MYTILFYIYIKNRITEVIPMTYVNFVSDEDFLKCIKHVVDGYIIVNEEIDTEYVLKHSRNTVDEFKAIFDIATTEISFEDWSKNELNRQNDKSLNNKIGEFHQMLLGSVDGWSDLGVGHPLGVDLKNDEETIFIELKNKYNTMNSSSSAKTFEKLGNVIKEYPNATAYLGIVIDKNYNSSDVIWRLSNYPKNRQIRRISGDLLYEMITGEPKALRDTFKAIPLAIAEVQEKDCTLSDEDIAMMNRYINYIFK